MRDPRAGEGGGLMDYRVTAVGFVIGIIAGISGIGGSSLLAPLLILALGVKPSIAVGTDLVYSVPMKLLAAFAHVRQGTVDRAVITRLSIGGVPGTLAGLGAFYALRRWAGIAQLDRIERHAIGIVILAAAVSALVLFLFRRRLAAQVDAEAAARRAKWTVAIGAVVGFLVALTSIGSGSITLPLLMLALPMVGLRALIGSEIVFGAIIIPIAAIGHAGFANVDWMLALSLAIGAVPGAYVGVRFCGFLGEGFLRPAVMIVLAYAGFKLL
ncbi:MAG TPA: sulfite exporter TauE/SafE family protein [Candidatus Elarobacter sp.]